MKKQNFLIGLVLMLCILTSCKKDKDKEEWELCYSTTMDEILGTFKGSGTYYEYTVDNNGSPVTKTTNSNDVSAEVSQDRANVIFYLNAPNVFSRTLSGAVYNDQPYIMMTYGGNSSVDYPDSQTKIESTAKTELNCEIRRNTNTKVIRYDGSIVYHTILSVYKKNSYGAWVLESSEKETPYKFTFVVEK